MLYSAIRPWAFRKEDSGPFVCFFLRRHSRAIMGRRKLNSGLGGGVRPCLLRQGQLKSAPRCPTVNPPTISERHPPTIGTKETYHAKTNSPLEHHHNRSVYCCDTVFRHS